MKLTFEERMTLSGVLPPQGDFLTLKIIRKLKESLSPTEEEWTKVDPRDEYKCSKCEQTMYDNPISAPKCVECDVDMGKTGMRVWRPENDAIKDIYLGAKAKEICVAVLKRLNDEQLLTEGHMSLYEKFGSR